jgi:lipid II:glycine glycyltransferase (peptidoglycan interpeptide bridge formation enzyme)
MSSVDPIRYMELANQRIAELQAENAELRETVQFYKDLQPEWAKEHLEMGGNLTQAVELLRFWQKLEAVGTKWSDVEDDWNEKIAARDTLLSEMEE